MVGPMVGGGAPSGPNQSQPLGVFTPAPAGHEASPQCPSPAQSQPIGVVSFPPVQVAPPPPNETEASSCCSPSGPGGPGGSGSLEQARAIGDTFTGGDVFWDNQNGAVFGKASGEANQDYLRIYSDKANSLQVLDSTKDGAGVIRPISIQFGGVEMVRIDPNGDTFVAGKLTVVGAIDPPSVSLSGGTALFFDSADGSTAPVSAAGHARIRYVNPTGWEQSLNGGAYTGFGGGGPGSDTTAWHNTGDAFGAAKVIGTTNAFKFTIKSNNVEMMMFDGPGTSGGAAGNFYLGDSFVPTSMAGVFVFRKSSSWANLSLVCTQSGATGVSGTGEALVSVENDIGAALHMIVSASDFTGNFWGKPLANSARLYTGIGNSALFLGTRTDIPIYFGGADVVRMIMTGDGRFSIGSVSLTGNQYFGVSGDANFSGQTIIKQSGYIGIGVDPAYTLYIRADITGSTNAVVVDNRHGTGEPQVIVGSDPRNTNSGIKMSYFNGDNTSGVTSSGAGTMTVGHSQNQAVSFIANNVERIRINGTGIGYFTATPVAQQTVGAVTNNVTAGGVDGTIADFTNLTVYATDAATIRNDIYQLARSVEQLTTAMRNYGLGV